jgi:hypothetical protein
MRHRNIILLAALLSLAALLVAAVPALAGNATAVPSPGTAAPDNAPIKVWPLPIQQMPDASSPAVYLPTATAKATPTAMPTPTMKTTNATMTDDVVAADQVAKVVDYGLTTTAASPGETITGYAVIRNTGKDLIKDAQVHLAVFEPRKNAHAIKVATVDQSLSNLDIAPGDQKRAEFSISLPGGASAGGYSLQATVIANGQQVETFAMPVTVN